MGNSSNSKQRKLNRKLLKACTKNNLDHIRYYINKGAKTVYRGWYYASEMTCLDFAFNPKDPDFEIIKLLLENGATSVRDVLDNDKGRRIKRVCEDYGIDIGMYSPQSSKDSNSSNNRENDENQKNIHTVLENLHTERQINKNRGCLDNYKGVMTVQKIMTFTVDQIK